MGWNPVKSFTGFLSDAWRKVEKQPNDLFGRGSLIGKTYRGISDLGAKVGDKVGINTSATDKRNAEEASQIAAARKAAHDAEVARLAEGSFGAVAMRRRKGMYASMFTGTPTLSTPNTGKTLLSQ